MQRHIYIYMYGIALMLAFFFAQAAPAHAITEVFTTTGTTTWQAPANVFSVTVEVYGAGGGSGGGTNTGQPGGSGGGGGAYARKVISVTPGQNYTYSIGAGGAENTTVPGGNSRFIGDGGVEVRACGGTGGLDNGGTAGVGGSLACSDGDTEFQGGNGAAGAGTVGGGGGEAASSTGAGNNASGQTGGTGGDGTDGSAGQAAGSNGVAGNPPGAGAGGSGRRSGGSESGATGGNGRMVITYTPDTSITLSGTLYSDEGSTAITNTKTIMAAVGTSTVSLYSTTTTGSGTFSITIPTGHTVGTSTPIVIWVDGDATTRAALFTKHANGNPGTVSGLHLYQNRVIVSHEGTSGTSTTNANMAFYDGDDDSDIQYTSNGGTLTVKMNQELHILTGKTFAPGGAVTISGNASSTSLTDGSFHLQDNATYTAGGTTTIAGSFLASSTAVINQHASGLVFNATTTGKSILAPITTMGNIRFEGAGGAWTFINAATTTNMRIVTGTVTAPSTALAIQGNYSNAGTFTHNSGTVYFASTSPGTAEFSGITFDTAASGNGSPYGITFAEGFYWITDYTDAEVYKYTATGSYTGTSFDTSGSGNANPLGIAYGKGLFWITDDIDAEVYQYTTSGTYTGTSFDTSASGNSAPRSITYGNGFLWVVDNIDTDVYKYSTDGTSISTFDTAATGSDSPWGITYANGYLWVVDTTDDEVYRYTTGGTYTNHSFDTNLSGNTDPEGLTYSNGSFVITDVAGTEGYFYDAGFQHISGTLSGTSAFNNLVFSGARGKAISDSASTSNITVDSAATLSLYNNFTVTGNYSNNGTTTHEVGTTTLSGTSQQTLSGNMTVLSAFNNLLISNTSGAGSSSQSILFSAAASTTDTLTMLASTSARFLANASTTFQNISLQGASGQPVYLRSSSQNSRYSFRVPGTVKQITYTDVKDSSSCPEGITASLATNIDSGNNVCWNFTVPPVAITLSGTLYSDEGQNAITTGKTIGIAIGTSTPSLHTTTSNGSGVWSFTTDTNQAIVPSTPIVAWVDGDVVKATTFTKASSTQNNIFGIDLYQSRVILKHEGFTGTSTTNTNLSFYDGDNDSDIMYTSNSGAYSQRAGMELHLAAGTTYVPGGTVTLHGNAGTGIDGDLHLPYGLRQDGMATSSLLNTGSNQMNIAGHLFASSSSAILSNNTISFTSTSTQEKQIIATSTTFFNLAFNGTTGSWTFGSNAATATDTFAINGGTLRAPSTNLSLESSLSKSGSGVFLNNGGTVTFYRNSGNQNISASMTDTSAFSNVIFRGAGTKSFGSNAASTTNLTIEATSGTVTFPSSALTIAGNFTNSSTTGGFNANGGTVYFSSTTGTTTYTGTSYLTSCCLTPFGIVFYDKFFLLPDVSQLQINKFNVSGSFSGVWFSTSPSGSPVGVTFGNNFFWILDSTNDEVYQHTATGTFTGVSFDTAGSGNDFPRDITFYDNHFWVTDGSDNRVYKYDANGTYTGISFDTAASGNDDPLGITFYNNAFWIVNNNDDEVYKYNIDGSYTGISFDTAASGNGSPRGITQADGYFWITDTTDQRIYKYTAATQRLSGTMTGNSSFNNLTFLGSGSKAFGSSASTSGNFTIDATSGQVNVPTTTLTISGNYTNSTTTGFDHGYGDIYFSSTSAQSLSGTMTGFSSFATTTFIGAGTKTFGNNASTTSFVIDSGATLAAPSHLTISGNYTNSGTFTAGSGTTTFNGTSQQTLSGTMTGGSAFGNLSITNSSASTTISNALEASNISLITPGTRLELPASATTTVSTLTITGSSTNRVWLRSTTPGTKAGLSITGTYAITYADVKDSSGTTTGGDILADDGTSIDSGNNNGWDFTAGGTKTWTGATSNVWTLDGNWSGNSAPTSVDDVIIDGNGPNAPLLDLAGAEVTIDSLTLGNSSTSILTLSNANTSTAKLTITNDLTIGGSGTIQHTSNTTTQTHVVHLNVGGNLTIDAGGKIDVTGRGYSTEQGIGKGTTVGSRGSGAGHGGYGGYGQNTTGGSQYGSTTAPTHIGSGGGNGNGSGGSGGGAVLLTVTGTSTVNGQILATGNPYNNPFAGGGSGGSIYLTTGVLAGNGTIAANGGHGSGGGGAGGRIALYYSTSTYTGTTTAYADTSDTQGHGGAGTIFTKAASATFGDLTIKNNSVTGAASTTLPVSMSLHNLKVQDAGRFYIPSGLALTLSSSSISGTTNGTTTVEAGGTLSAASLSSCSNTTIVNNGSTTVTSAFTIGNGCIWEENATSTTFTDLTVASGGILSHSLNGSAQTYDLNATLANLTIDAGGFLDVSGKGYATENGPGKGTTSGSRGSGAGYGGEGGYGETTAGGSTYGSTTAPIDLGSGGGVGNGTGGAGGGSAKLTVTGTTTINGQILASGRQYNNPFAGGGSGGSIWLNTVGLAGNGTIAANGGLGSGGSGSGGRIALYYTANTYTGTTTAFGGIPGWRSGGAGTIYMKGPSATYGDLILKNNNVAGASTTASTSIAFDNISIIDGAHLVVATNTTITVASSSLTGTTNATATVLYGGTLSSASLSSCSNINVVNNGTVTLPSAFSIGSGCTWSEHATSSTTFTDLTISSGGILTHLANAASETYRINAAMTNLTINTGGKIDVTGKGYSIGNGPGAGTSASSRGSGAGHGGNGGYGETTSGGTAYGSTTAPTTIGSGGGQGASSAGVGGGAVRLTVSGTTTINGELLASSLSPVTAFSGGGSGGSIWLTTGALAGNGTIAANGGRGSGGGGSGGRIALQYTNYTYTGTTTAYGQTSDVQQHGGAGTIYMKPATTTFGHLLVDNNSNVGASTTATTTLLFDNITVQNAAKYYIASSTNASTSNLTISSGSYFTAPTLLSISGNYSNSGTFTAGSGTVYFSNSAATNTYTGTSFDTAASGNLEPRGMVFANGFFWAVDNGNNEVYKYNSDGSYTGISFDTSTGAGEPLGITYANGYFWITSNAESSQVFKYNSDGTYTGSFFTLDGNQSSPGALTFYNGFFWIIDRGAGGATIYKYTADGTYTGTTLSIGAGGNNDPYGITAFNNLLYVVDIVDDAVYRYTLDGTASGSFNTSGVANDPRGIATVNGFLWITDRSTDKVYKYTAATQRLSGTMTGNSSFNDIVFLGAGGKAFDSSASTTGNFTIDTTSGQVSAPTTTLTISGNYTNSTSTGFDHSYGTVYFSSSSAQTLSGTMTVDSAFASTSFLGSGTKTFSSNASTTGFTIGSGAVTAPALLSIAGNYSNSGTFTAGSGTTTFNGASQQTLSGTMTGGSAFGNLSITNSSASTTISNALEASNISLITPGTRLELPASATTTVSTLTITGSSTNRVWLRSTTPGTKAGLSITGTYAITYADVKDSSGTTTGGDIIANDGTSIDSGNNNGWDFTAGGSKTWTGATSNVWTLDGNWSGNSAPTSVDDVIIDGNGPNAPLLDLAGAEVTIGSLTLGNSSTSILTLSNANTSTAKLTITNDLTIGGSGTIQHTSNTTTQTHVVNLSVDGNLTIDAGGKIDVSSRGFVRQAGPGAGGTGAPYSGGGGYGGNGGAGTQASGGTSYGSTTAPTNIGSGGGNATGGGAGGGLVLANVVGTTTVNGQILATGETTGNAAGGGGSGGSIWLTTSGLAGNGTIAANGGNSGAGNNSPGGGGGGRVTLEYTTNTYTGTTTAYGGTTGNEKGGAGTIFTKSAAATFGDLVVDNNNVVGANTTLTSSSTFADLSVRDASRYVLASSTTLTLASSSITGTTNSYLTMNRGSTLSATNLSTCTALNITNNGTASIASSFTIGNTCTWEENASSTVSTTFTDLTIASGGVLTHSANSTLDTYKLNASLNSLTIDAGGKIDISAKGYQRQAGPGAGGTGSPYSGGGGYGGNGGASTQASGGTSYGSTTAPTDIGSGGGNATGGGAGGGALKLTVSGTTTVNGQILATGETTANGGGGGGSGGSIWLTTSGLAGNGTIAANGGNSGAGSNLPGAGGGGRIALQYTTYAYTGTTTAYGGATSGNEKGGAGTVLTKTATSTFGNVRIDNNGVVGANTVATTTLLFDNITVQNAARYHIGASSNASTTNLTIGGNSIFTAPTLLSISGDYSNSGTFTAGSGTTTLNGTSQQTLSGTLTGASAFANLVIANTWGTGSSSQSVLFSSAASTTDTLTMFASTSARFLASATSTFENISLQGASGQYVWLRSSNPNTQYSFYVPGLQKQVSFVNVRDSNACPITITTSDSVNAGNNTCWVFPGNTDISSAENQTFTYLGATTSMSVITLTEGSSPTITAANDIRIVIATTSANMRWDTAETTAVFGGTASGKVSNPVSYLGGGEILVIPVDTDFSGSDTLTVSGLSFSQFGSVHAAAQALGLRTDGVGTTTNDTDDKTITIKGSMTLADHTQDQVGDNFDFVTDTNVPLYAFNITPNGENADVSELVLSLSNVNNILTPDLTNLLLYRDQNSDKLLDGGDVQVGGSGAFSLSGRAGTVTFSTSFSATTTKDYLLVGDYDNVYAGDAMQVSLSTSDVTAAGATSLASLTTDGSAEDITHRKGGQAGGGGGEAGGNAPPGGGNQGGGDGGGGSEIGSDSEDTLGSEPGFFAPTQSGTPLDEWTNGTNALASDGVWATAASTLSQSYGNFGFGVPGGNQIMGIEVKFEAHGSTAAGTISVRLSWDGGSSVTSLQTTGTLTTSDVVYSLGGPSDLWGRSWSAAEFNNGNFTIEVLANPSSNTIRVDAIQVRVYHQTSGGGGGGGGEVSIPSNRHFANLYSAFGSMEPQFWTLVGYILGITGLLTVIWGEMTLHRRRKREKGYAQISPK